MVIALWSGIVLGAIYAMVAVGLTLTVLPTGVFNFAQGVLTIGGGYLGYEWMTKHGLAEWQALLIDAAAGALVGVACELLTVRPLRIGGRTDISTSAILTTIGSTTAISGILGVKFGYLPLRVPFKGPVGRIDVGGTVVYAVELIVVGIAVVSAVAFHLWFRRTFSGQTCLAVAEDQEAAMLRGANVSRISILAFGTAGLYGGAVGTLVGSITYAAPQLGLSLTLGGFVALALGGQGNFLGSLFGGLLVGIVNSLSVTYIGVNYGQVAVLILLLVVFVAKPSGIGGAAALRNV